MNRKHLGYSVLAGGIVIVILFLGMSYMPSVSAAKEKDNLGMDGPLFDPIKGEEIMKQARSTIPLDDRNGNRIDDRLEKDGTLESYKPVEVVILMNFHKDWNTLRYNIPDSAIEQLEDAGMDVFDVLYYTNIAHGTVPGRLIPAMAKLPFVSIISRVAQFEIILDSSVPAMHADPNSLANAGVAGIDGTGMTIAVLDSGIYGGHDAFQNPSGKIVAWQDFIAGASQPYDDHGHGTHCASIAAGNPSSDPYKGVAPEARLIGLKVMDASGQGGYSISQGMDWCVSHAQQYSIDVASMSLGTVGGGDSYVDSAAGDMVTAGIVVVAAAGNEGETGSPPKQPMGSPARAQVVITVGASYDDGTRCGFSTWGVTDGAAYDASDPGQYALPYTKPEVLAPGIYIKAANSYYNGDWTDMGGEASYAPGAGTPWIESQGTSMACPHVAGMAALMLEVNTGMTQTDVKEAMKAHTKPGTGSGDGDFRRGWGMVQVAETLAAIGHPPQLIDFGANGQQSLEVDEDQTITFSATATDEDGYIAQYVWDFDAKNGITDQDAVGQSVTWSYEKSGTYVVTVQAIDNDGLSAKGQISVSVRNVVPTAAITGGDKTVDMDEEVTLDASASTDTPSDIPTLTYSWDLNGDGTYGDKAGVSITHKWTQPGTFTVGLQVEDDDGATAEDTITITVNNVAPIARAKVADSMSGVTIYEDMEVEFDATGSTDTESDKPGLQYKWDFDDSDGVDWDNPDSTKAKPKHSYNQSGSYTVSLLVVDPHGTESDVDTLTIVVHNQDPEAVIQGVSNPTPEEMEWIYIDARGTTDTESDQPYLNYTWDLDIERDSNGDGVDDNDADAYGIMPYFEVMRDGDITAKLTVTDDDGATSTATYTYTAKNKPPVVNQPDVFDEDGNPVTEIDQGETLILRANITDVPEDLEIMEITWELPDHSVVTGWEIQYTPQKTGPMSVKITAVDNVEEDAVSETFTGIVNVKNRPPTITSAPKDMVVNDGATVSLSVEYDDSADDLELIVVHWDFGDGSEADGATVSHKFTGGGSTKEVRVSVTDPAGNVVTHTFNVTVNSLPVAKLGEVPESVKPGEKITLDASGSMDSEGPVTIYWDMDSKKDSDGDGNPSNDKDAQGTTLEVSFDDPGMHYMTLIVVDSNGGTTTKDFVVNVEEPSIMGGGMSAEALTSPSMENGGLILYLVVLLIIVGVAVFFIMRKRAEKKDLERMKKEWGDLSDNGGQSQAATDPYAQYQTAGTQESDPYAQYDQYDSSGGGGDYNYGGYDDNQYGGNNYQY